jgi:excisionase family DNA binding protein
MSSTSELMTRQEAAEYLRLTEGALAMMASRGQGPPYIPMGHRSVRYRRSDLDRWTSERTVNPDKRRARTRRTPAA